MNAKVRTQAEGLARTGRPLEWLFVILISWLLPLELLFNFNVTYFSSLLFWLVPILLLSPRFLLLARSTRRRAFWCTVALIALLGLILDFVLGTWVLIFDGKYLLTLPSLGGKRIPLEEILFYILGAWAVLLTYVWCDEYWLQRYSVRSSSFTEEAPGPLIGFSKRWALTALALLGLGIFLKALFRGPGPWFPLYFSFLVVVAFAPAIVVYPTVKNYVNWQALSWAGLYLMLTSCIWEVTLALPRKWWGYEETATLGRTIRVWSFPNGASYPLEALLVWIAGSFACVLYYEFFRAFFRDPRPAKELLRPWRPTKASPTRSDSL